MKKLLFLLLTIISVSAFSQQTLYSRFTNQIKTVPNSDTVQGKIYTDSAYSSTYKFLKYIGTTNMANVFPNGAIGKYGWMYIYIPATSTLAKVISVATVGDATIDTFRIEVATATIGIYNRAFKSIVAKDWSYSIQNDGGSDGAINGVAIKTGTSLGFSKDDIAGTSNTTWQEPIIVNSTGTSFLILERKSQ